MEQLAEPHLDLHQPIDQQHRFLFSPSDMCIYIYLSFSAWVRKKKKLSISGMVTRPRTFISPYLSPHCAHVQCPVGQRPRYQLHGLLCLKCLLLRLLGLFLRSSYNVLATVHCSGSLWIFCSYHIIFMSFHIFPIQKFWENMSRMLIPVFFRLMLSPAQQVVLVLVLTRAGALEVLLSVHLGNREDPKRCPWSCKLGK